MRIIFCILIAIFIALYSTAQAATKLSVGTLQQLVQLEKKYFSHSFDNDSDEQRVSRIEQYVLGGVNNGNPEQRVKNIVEATSDDPTTDDAKSSYSGTVTAPDEKVQDSQPNQKTDKFDNSSAMQKSGTTGSNTSDSYPHITNLENAILGKSYVGQQLSERLARMETKAFGHASTDTDLSQRADALDQYAAEKLHMQVQAPPSDLYETAAADESQHGADQSQHGADPGQHTDDQSDYPRITELEKAILGQSFPGEALPDRIARMETKAFGSPSSNSDLSQRTDALDAYAEKTLHKKLPTQAQNREAANAQPGGSGISKGLASFVGNSLLGMLGVGGGGIGTPLGAGPGFAGSGIGIGGMGGGMHRHSRQEQQPEPKPEPRAEDPAVMAPNAPPPDSKMLVKVGWCEMQIFGQTFPKMHLPDRLGKLNRELNFEPGKSDVDLMDDVDKLIKAVQIQKKGRSTK